MSDESNDNELNARKKDSEDKNLINDAENASQYRKDNFQNVENGQNTLIDEKQSYDNRHVNTDSQSIELQNLSQNIQQAQSGTDMLYQNINPDNANENILNTASSNSSQINQQIQDGKNQLDLDSDKNFRKVFGVSRKESGIRSSSVRQKNNGETQSISKKSKSGSKLNKTLAWSKSSYGLAHYDKDKDAAANTISNTTSFMVNNPYTNKLVDKIKREFGKESLKKINNKAIKKIAEKKTQDLINKGVKNLSTKDLDSIMDKADSGAAKEMMGKLSDVKRMLNTAQKIRKGNIIGAGSELIQRFFWKKMWPVIVANPHIVMAVVVIVILLLMGIGAYVSVSNSTNEEKLRIEMNRVNEYAYDYQKPDNYSADQQDNAKDALVSDMFHESVQIRNQNKIYKWLNDYFFNVDSASCPRNINNIKQIGEDILLEFAKKIVVTKRRQYQVSDDIFLNYFYDTALGELSELDEKIRKQVLLDYIVNELGDKDKIVINSEILEKYIDEKFKYYIEMMSKCIKNNEVIVETGNDEDLDEANRTDQNESEKEKNAGKLTDDQKEEIISEFKESVSDNETIDIDYYEKIYYDQEINFENESILGTQNDIYELMYLLYFIDKISANDLDDVYILEIDKYKKLVENIYNETTKLSLDLVWNSNDTKENKLHFIVSEKTNDDTNASIELADIMKSTYKKKYDDLKKQIISMDEEVENIEYIDDDIFDIWAIFNNELEYLNKDDIDTDLLSGNNKLANSYKAMVSKTLQFITEMRKYTDELDESDVWEEDLNQLKEYLEQITADNKNKFQVKDISQNIFDHLKKLQAMAYATGSDQYGSDDTKKVFNKYVGKDVSKYVEYYHGNSLFRDLWIFKQKLEKLSDTKIINTMINSNNNDDTDIQTLAGVWKDFKFRLSIVFDLYSDKYIFGMCYDHFPNKISDYLSNSIKEIESGEILGIEMINIVDEKIIAELNNWVKALDIGLELNNQKFDEKKNIMYKNIKHKSGDDEKNDKNFDTNEIKSASNDIDIEIYENIDLNDLKVSEDETRFRKININSNGSNEVYFLFNDIAQIESIKSVFVMNNFGKWFSDSDFYNMFFIDEDYGFDLEEKNQDSEDEIFEFNNIFNVNVGKLNGTEFNEIENENDQIDINIDPSSDIANEFMDQSETGSYYDDFKNSILQLSQIFNSMIAHDVKKTTDFGYELKLKEKENNRKDDNDVASDYHNFMEIENLIPGENIYSICSGFVDTINKDENKLIVKYYEDEEEEEEDDDDDDDDDEYEEEYDDDENLNDYNYNSFDKDQDLYIIYEGLNINNNLSVGQKIIRDQNNITTEKKDEKDLESKKPTVIGTATDSTLKIYVFLSSDDRNNKKEFVNPFLICDIHSPFEPVLFGPEETELLSPSQPPSPKDERETDYQYYPEENKSEFKSAPQKVEHRSLLKVFGEIIHIAGMIYAVWAIVKFSLGLHDYESVNYQAIWQFFAASILIFGGILLKYISGLR